ncbi:MAG: F0F1 ATP synthase subunit A [Clostridia bacterium]|nr:F0F1 ATP synthase subunit A [Clostridia bacterium]
MDLGEYLSNAMETREVFSFYAFGYQIPVYDSIVVMWIIIGVLIVLSVTLTRNFKTVPSGKQNIVEIVVELVNSITKSSIGHHWRHFAPYFGTILLFLVFANTISIFGIIPSSEELYKLTGLEFFEHIPVIEIKPPTKDFGVNVTMAVMSIIVVLGAGLRFKGLKGWLGSLVDPLPVMIPFKILDYFIRPLSLSARLFGNILGAFLIVELAYIALPAVFPAALNIYFDLFDGILQAYIFVFLTSIYVAEAIE